MNTEHGLPWKRRALASLCRRMTSIGLPAWSALLLLVAGCLVTMDGGVSYIGDGSEYADAASAARDGERLRTVSVPAPRMALRMQPAKAFSHYAPMSVKPQLPSLRAAAQAGDARAACTLASVFHLCAKAEFMPTFDQYSSAYLAGMDKAQAERFAMRTAYFDERVSVMCDGIDAEDMRDMGERWLQSVMAGFSTPLPRRLWLYADAEPVEAGERRRLVGVSRDSVERMLNRAAESGDVAAIEAVSMAYVIGRIATPAGTVALSPDHLKASAASYALLMIRDEKRKRKLPVDEYADDESIRGMRGGMSVMNAHELAEFTRISTMYYQAYQARFAGHPAEDEMLAELPESVCRDDEWTALL